MGGFNRMERVNKLNRLIEIEQYLIDRNMLESTDLSSSANFQYDFEVPAEHADAVQTYLHQVEEIKSRETVNKSKAK
jgi:hypothetical protein